MKKRIIAIDCDDVLVATASAAIGCYNKKYGTGVTLDDYYTFDPAPWGVPDIQTVGSRIAALFAADKDLLFEPPRETIEAVLRLSAQHELHVVTGRSEDAASATRDMLARYFPGVFRSVEFTSFFGKAPRPKAQVCQELGVDMLIDDHLHHAKAVAEDGIEVLLFGEYPWNRTNTLPPNITRVRDWREIEAHLKL